MTLIILPKAAAEVQPITASAAPFAVLELFTSEGCSSCPPADAILSEITAEARRGGVRVFPLSLHVDDWNSNEWADSFSGPVYSARQKLYAKTFTLSDIYTPQIIVNGTEAFSGLNDKRIKQSIENALQQPASVFLLLTLNQTGNLAPLSVEYNIKGDITHAVLNLALVERAIVERIQGGENKGRTLRYDNVVHIFKIIALNEKDNGIVTLTLPPFLKQKNASIIGYVQDALSMKILGAESVDLPVFISMVNPALDPSKKISTPQGE